jgi:hypothetical protein
MTLRFCCMGVEGEAAHGAAAQTEGGGSVGDRRRKTWAVGPSLG